MECKIKTTLLLSTLAVTLMGAAPSFAQAVNMGPSRPYDAQGYEDLGPGPSDYGYYQGRVITGRQAPHARVTPRSVEPNEQIR
jgi:hypothetical protein